MITGGRGEGKVGGSEVRWCAVTREKCAIVVFVCVSVIAGQVHNMAPGGGNREDVELFGIIWHMDRSGSFL